MAPTDERGLIFPADDDKSNVLAVLEASNLSALAFVPIADAIERGLRFHFVIPDRWHRNNKATTGSQIPLKLTDGQQIFLHNGPGWQLARAINTENQE